MYQLAIATFLQFLYETRLIRGTRNQVARSQKRFTFDNFCRWRERLACCAIFLANASVARKIGAQTSV